MAKGTATELAPAPPGDLVSAAHNAADTDFAQLMILHHEGAVEMADLAAQQDTTAEVQSLAEEISAAQGPEIETMAVWLETWGEGSTPGGDATDHDGMQMEALRQQEAMADLAGRSGASFDERFLELMTAHHLGAVEMSETELGSGQNPQALELAQQIIVDQEAEIEQMAQLLGNL